MKPEEKMHWFWVTGALPGSMFDDWNDRKAKQPSHGRSGLARVFYGSVSAGVLHRVNRPLLVIRSDDYE